jgi:hypothetical protein
MVLLQLCAIAGVFGAIPVQFRCNSGAILVQFWCNSGAILVQFWCNLHLRLGDLPPAWDDSKLATLIVIGRVLSGSATGRHQ